MAAAGTDPRATIRPAARLTCLRPAVRDDLARLAQLVVQAAHGKQRPIDVAKVVRGLQLVMGDQHALLLVAERGGTAVALVTLQDFVDVEAGAVVGYVRNLVLPADGACPHLLEDLLAGVQRYANKRGYGALHLPIDPRDDATLGQLRKAGWQLVPALALQRVLAQHRPSQAPD